MNNGKVVQSGTPQTVYDSPSSPFVYDFIGNVNRVTTEDASSQAFVRPQDVELAASRNGGAAIGAVVRYVTTIGPTVRLELERIDTAEVIEAEMTRERYLQAPYTEGDHVFMTLQNLRVFAAD